MTFRNGLASIGVVLGLAGLALAQDVMTATYDVRDLLISIPDYQNPPPATQPTRQAIVDEVLAVVRAVLPADATVRELGGQLILTGTADAHAAVKDALRRARDGRSRQVMIESRVIRIDDATFDALSPELRTTILTAALDHGRQPGELSDTDARDLLTIVRSGSESAAPTPGKLADVDFRKPAKAVLAQRDGGTMQLTAPRLTTFNNQQAEVRIQSETNFVKDLKLVVGQNGEKSTEPEIGTVKSGVVLSTRASTTRDASAVALQYRLELTRLLGVDAAPVAGGHVQRPRVAVDRFEGVAVVPRGQWLLVMPAEHTGESDPQARTLLLLRPTGIVQREVEQP